MIQKPSVYQVSRNLFVKTMYAAES